MAKGMSCDDIQCSFYVLCVSNLLFLSNLHILLGFFNKVQTKNNPLDEIVQLMLLCYFP